MRFIHALGATVRVELGDELDLDEFSAAWSRCIVDDPHPGWLDDSIPTVWEYASMTGLTQSITRALIRQRAGELLMLHAGAVCDPETGRSIAYIAPGGTGKTTLTRLLGEEYGYITDETVGVEPATWRILPYEKPLSVRNGEGGRAKTEHGPDSLGLQPVHPSPTLSTLAVIRRSAGYAAAPSFTKPGFLDIIPSLVPETSSLTRLDRPLRLLAELDEAVGGIWLVEYADAGQLRGWVREQLHR